MPGVCQKTRSAPQKQPMPTIACSVSSGKGGSSGVPSTKWVSGTWKGRVSRPGSASAALGHLGLVAEEEAHTIETSVTVSPMAAQVAELDLPELDFFDVGLRGERFHRTMDELSSAGWLASSPSRLLRARPRVGGVLPAHEGGHVPGDEDRRDVRGARGPAARADAPQHPPHQRRRPPAPAQPRQPGLHAARRRPLAAGDARLPRAPLGAARRTPTAASSSRRSPSPTRR